MRILGGKTASYEETRLKVYDFRRPDKFSKEQIRSVEIVHETFARLAATRLGSRLRLPCAAKVSVVDQMTWGEFIDPLPGPAVLAVLGMAPLKGAAVMQLEAGLSEPILERLFGAGTAAVEASSAAVEAAGGLAARDITDIEHQALSLLLAELATDLGTAWEPVRATAPALLELETQPRFCQIVAPTEMILLVELSVELGGAGGRLRLAFPWLLVEPVIGALSARHWYRAARGAPAETLPASLAWRLEADTELLFEGGRLSIGDLRALRRGSLVPVPGLDRGTGRLRAGGREVRRLRLLGRGPAGEYLLEPAERAGEAESAALALEERAGGKASDREAAGLERSLGALGERFEASLGKLGEGLKALAGRQDELADKLLFGGGSSADGPGGEAAARPFAGLSGTPPEALAAFLASERPQFAALVLSWLDDTQASRVLAGLPQGMQVETVRRVAGMERVLPECLEASERVLSRKMGAILSGARTAGGVGKVVGLLNLVPRETEKRVVEGMEVLDPALAEEVKRSMFVFEDISILADESIAEVLSRAEPRDILVAMKPVPDALRERIFTLFGRASGAELEARLRAEYARIGRVRLSECDAAGQRVVALVRSLEEEGRIVVEREGE